MPKHHALGALHGGSCVYAYIESVGAYVPTRVMTNDDIADFLETSDEWIFSHTGIRNRHIAADGETSSDMGFAACRSALEKCSVDPKEIDLILVATSTPDFIGFPSTASLIQERLGAERAGAMDMFAACTGFIYGLDTARAFIESGNARKILVVGSEAISRILDWTDRNTCVLFGDAAGAVLVSAAEEGSVSRIEHGLLRSQGSGADYLFVDGYNPSTTGPEKSHTEPHAAIRMNGHRVYNFAVKALCDTMHELLDVSKVDTKDIRYVVPHQANVRIIDAAGKRMGLPGEIFYTNMHEYANTSAASIPLALNEMAENELLNRGDLILTIGFGGGLTYGGNLIYW